MRRRLEAIHSNRVVGDSGATICTDRGISRGRLCHHPIRSIWRRSAPDMASSSDDAQTAPGQDAALSRRLLCFLRGRPRRRRWLRSAPARFCNSAASIPANIMAGSRRPRCRPFESARTPKRARHRRRPDTFPITRPSGRPFHWIESVATYSFRGASAVRKIPTLIPSGIRSAFSIAVFSRVWRGSRPGLVLTGILLSAPILAGAAVPPICL